MSSEFEWTSPPVSGVSGNCYDFNLVQDFPVPASGVSGNFYFFNVPPSVPAETPEPSKEPSFKDFKEAEDYVSSILDWNPGLKALIYKTLYNSCMRRGSCDGAIDKYRKGFSA